MIITLAQTTRERENQAIAICDEHCERVVVCTPTKLVLEAHNLVHSMLASRKLQAEGFSVSTHEVGNSWLMHVALQ